MQGDVEAEVSVPHSGLDAMSNAPTPSSLLFTSLAWDPDVDGPNAAQIMETMVCLSPAPTSADFL